MNGTTGNDTLTGTRFDEILDGLEGDDIIKAKGGNDTVLGGSGNDKLYGNGGDDTVEGGEGNDRLWGGNGNDMLFGGIGNDRLWGGNGTDILEGGEGNDRLKGQRGDDTLNGGEGTDWAIYSGALEDFDIVLRANGDLELTDMVGTEGTDTLTSIEKFRFSGQTFLLEDVLALATREIVGTSSNDRLEGTEANDILDGLSGNDVLVGEGGNDTLIGGSGFDRLYGGEGSDTLRGGDGNDWLSAYGTGNIFDGGAGFDTVFLSSNFDLSGSLLIDVEKISGSSIGDVIDLSAYDSDFTVQGVSGDDRIISGKGDDTIDGEASYIATVTTENTVVYSGNRDDYTVSIDDHGTITVADNRAGGDGTDTIRNIGTFEFADGAIDVATLVGAGDGPGTILSEEIFGSYDNDVIDALGGDDSIQGMDGNDTLNGGAGDDLIEGGYGDDILIGGTGNDALAGGEGFDTAVFTGNSDEYETYRDHNDVLIVADLVEGRDGETQLYEVEVLQFADSDPNPPQNVEPTEGADVLIGSAIGDEIFGLGGNDIIEGRQGADFLAGDDGDDRIIGGADDDWLEGGAGADTFVFAAGFGVDRVEDYEAGIDSIELVGLSMDDIILNDNYDGASIEVIDQTNGNQSFDAVIFIGTTVADIENDLIFV